MTSASNFLKIEATHYIVIVHITECMLCLNDEQEGEQKECLLNFIPSTQNPGSTPGYSKHLFDCRT